LVNLADLGIAAGTPIPSIVKYVRVAGTRRRRRCDLRSSGVRAVVRRRKIPFAGSVFAG
jgi:hypothetical protein